MATKYRTTVSCKVTEDGDATVKLNGRADDFVYLAHYLFETVTEQMTEEECAALWRQNIVPLLKSFGLEEEAHHMELRLLEEEEKANVGKTESRAGANS